MTNYIGQSPCDCGWYFHDLPLTGETEKIDLATLWTIEDNVFCPHCGTRQVKLIQPDDSQLVINVNKKEEIENVQEY